MPIRINNFKNLGQKRTRIYDHQALSKVSSSSKERRKKKFHRFVTIVLATLILSFVAFIFFQIPGYFDKLSRPFKNIPGSYANISSLNFDNRTNILLISYSDNKLSELALASLAPFDKKVMVVSLDPQTVLFDGQATRFADLLDFKNGSNVPVSLDKIKAAVMETIFYPIDGYLAISTNSSWIKQDGFEKMANNLYSPGFFLSIAKSKDFLDKNLRTNLSVGELFTLLNKIKALSPDRFSFVDLAEFKTISGTLDYAAAKNNIGISLVDPAIANENATIQIINASGTDGVGNILKNIVTNLGANILEVSSQDVVEKQTQIFVRDKKNLLGQMLGKILNKDIKTLNNNQINLDVKVIIGKDFGSFFDF